MAKAQTIVAISPESICETTSNVLLLMQQGRGLEETLQYGITAAKTLLQVDRVIIYCFLAVDKAVVSFEAISPGGVPLLGQLLDDVCLSPKGMDMYHQGETTAIADVSVLLQTDIGKRSDQCQMQAHLTVPIFSQGNLWGLLSAHYCCNPHDWQLIEVQLLQQMALQLGLAVDLAQLRQHRDQSDYAMTLGESEARFRLMADSAPVLIWLSDSDGQCIFFNKTWLKFTGRIDAQLGDRWTEDVHPDDLPDCLNHYWTAFQAQQPFQMEYRLRHASGEYRWILDHGVPRFTPTGEFAGFVGSCTDIHNRKTVEIALRESEARLRRIADTNIVGIVWCTATGEIIEANDAFLQMVAYSQVDVSEGTLRWDGITPPEYQEIDRAAVDRLLTNGWTQPFEKEYWRKDGSRVAVMVAAALIEAGSDQAISVIVDISKRKQREDLIQNIAQGVSATTGAAFFQSLVQYLIRLFKVDQAFVAELLPAGDRMKIIAGLNNGQLLDGLEYALSGTPCEQVVTGGFGIYPADLQHNWHTDVALGSLGVQAYVGIPLINSTGVVTGVIGVVSNRPLDNSQLLQEVLTIFAGRAASELERQLAETMLRRYERIIAFTPDCVSLLDRNYVYQVVNQTYLAWNNKSYGEIVGHSVSELLGQEFFESVAQPYLDRCLAGETRQVVEAWLEYADGEQRFTRATYAPYVEPDGAISGVVINVHNLTGLKRAEEALRLSEERLRLALEASGEGLWDWNVITGDVYRSPRYLKLLGYDVGEFSEELNSWEESIHPDDVVAVRQRLTMHLKDDTVPYGGDYRMRTRLGEWRWFADYGKVVHRDGWGKPLRMIGTLKDISECKQAEAVLSQQAERERLLVEIAQHIRQTLDLREILNTTVIEVRRFLHTDRVVIYRFEPDWSGTIITESVADGWQSVLEQRITDTYFVQNQGRHYQLGDVKATTDIYAANFHPCHVRLLAEMQVRAKLLVPIVQDDHLWGLLVAHHCSAPREWQTFEIELLQQLTNQIAIAIQQSELYQQVQTLNADLELQVHERTAQLQQSLDFEALLKRITDHVRDSLDEQQILQRVVQEVAIAMSADCCNVALYNSERTISTIKYEYAAGEFVAKDWPCMMVDSTDPNLYMQLLQGHYCHFCLIGEHTDHLDQLPRAILACPVVDDQGVLGDLWLFRSAAEWFNDLEVRLVQQVANQCAIALRQSRLYQASQAQVQELERLNGLKDDFLSTVSHELRSPMSSIKLAIQMLEISLKPLGVFADGNNSISRYFRILQEEGEREISLINDLLDLARLDAETEAFTWQAIALQDVLPQLANPFIARTQNQQQRLMVHIPPDLPLWTVDRASLDRIVTELLHNACKYTPAAEVITLSAQATVNAMEIWVSNSGVEIPLAECDRIFDKFYRIPKNDPWKHGGTGLGLALVKKLAERLGGNIRVISQAKQTTFIVTLPQQ